MARVVKNRCVFSAPLKALSDRSGDRSAGGRRFRVAGPLTAKLRCPVAVRYNNSIGPTNNSLSILLRKRSMCICSCKELYTGPRLITTIVWQKLIFSITAVI